MREQEPVQTATATQPKPVPEGHTTWNDYWTKVHNQPWRTEPEIDKERQTYLTERRAVKPDIEQGIYPFKDVKLDRADVEWLLATHESGGMVGPVHWDDLSHRLRSGLDLRGAILNDLDLRSLPLARLQGGLTGDEFFRTSEDERRMASLRMQRTRLTFSRMERAILTYAHLEGAAIDDVRFEGADLYHLHLAASSPPDIRRAVFDADTNVARMTFANADGVGPRTIGLRWGGTSLTAIEWPLVRLLEDEVEARRPRTLGDGQIKSDAMRLRDFDRAVQAYRQLATALRSQGLNEDADRFAYRAQLLQRQVLRRQGIQKWPSYLGSLFLWALAGYGYRIWRIFGAYALVLMIFAVSYYLVGLPDQQAASTFQQATNALQVSLTAIHGRVFFEQFGIGSALAWVAAVESVVGIVIEGVFVAMLIQRFFAR
jgi:hypothetical protein